MNYGIRPLSRKYAPTAIVSAKTALGIPMPCPMRNRFDPRKIPGLQSWWDAADSESVVLDSGRVSRLSDKSGNNRHLTNATSGSTQPSYISNGRNGLNVVRFDRASIQRLSVPSSTVAYKFLSDGTPCYWIAVYSYGPVASNIQTFMANEAGFSNQQGFHYYNDTRFNNALNFQVQNGTSTPAVFSALDSGGIPAAAWQNLVVPNAMTVHEVLMDAGNATAANRFALRINGGATVAANVYLGTPSTSNGANNLHIGTTPDPSFPLTGDVCELLMFNQQPTSAARDLIRRYLGAKWGVTVG